MNLRKSLSSYFRKQRNSRKRTHRKLTFESCEPRTMLATYVVDAANGSDDNPCTAAQPCETYLPLVSTYGQTNPNIGKIQLQPGDIVELRPGVYDAAYEHPFAGWRGFSLGGVRGEPGNEIIIRGGPNVTLKATAPDGSEVPKVYMINAAHIRLEGFEITGHGDGIIVTSSSHITLANNWVHDITGESTTLIAGIDVEHSSEILVYNNLIHDNYDRRTPAFNSFNVEFNANTGPVEFYNNVVFNTDANIAGGTGPAVKHSGEGLLHIHHNVINGAANAGVSADTQRALVHHNLVIDSSHIKVAPNYTAREETLDVDIFNNSIVDRTPGDGVGGGFRANFDRQANPGTVSFDRNLVVHQEPYVQNHAMINIATYASDDAYAQWISTGNFSADGNHYFNPSHELLFDIFSSRSGGQAGGLYQFAEWQAQGYDQQGSVADPRFDDAFIPQNVTVADSGWYADDDPRLTVLVVGDDLIDEGDRTRLAIVRSGASLNAPLQVSLSTTDRTEATVPTTVTIPAGQRKAYFDVAAVSDGETDGTRAIRIDATAAGFMDNVSAWVRIADDGQVGDPDPQPGDLVSYAVNVRDQLGNPISSLSPGEQFFVDVVVRDLRTGSDRQGVFSAYVDLTADRPDLINVNTTSLVHGSEFQNALDGTVNNGSLIVNEGGGVGDRFTTNAAEQLLFTIEATAGPSPGTIRLELNPADVPLLHDTLLYGHAAAVQADQIQFESTSIEIATCGSTDINCDGLVTPIDALLVLNDLNAQASYNATRDVNHDGVISPIDALFVINELNLAPEVLAEGEGSNTMPSGFRPAQHTDDRQPLNTQRIATTQQPSASDNPTVTNTIATEIRNGNDILIDDATASGDVLDEDLLDMLASDAIRAIYFD